MGKLLVFKRLLALIALAAILGVVSLALNRRLILPSKAAPHYKRGLELEKHGDAAGALVEWRIAMRVDPDFAPPYRKVGSYLLDKAERPDLAWRVYARLIEIDPTGAHNYCSMARCLALANELREAQAYAETAVLEEPRCARAQNILGTILMTQRETKKGIKPLQRAVELDPQNLVYRLVLVQAYLDTSNFDSAIGLLRTTLARFPKNAKAHYLMGYAYAKSRTARDDMKVAERELKEAIRLEPDAPDAYAQLGALLYQTDRKSDAIIVLEKAIKLDPRSLQAAHHLARAYRSAGRLMEARQMTQKAQALLAHTQQLRILRKKLALHPQDTKMILQLAECEMQDGNLHDALRYANMVLNVRPDHVDALRLLRQIYTVGGKPDMAETVEKHLRSLETTLGSAHSNSGKKTSSEVRIPR